MLKLFLNSKQEKGSLLTGGHKHCIERLVSQSTWAAWTGRSCKILPTEQWTITDRWKNSFQLHNHLRSTTDRKPFSERVCIPNNYPLKRAHKIWLIPMRRTTVAVYKHLRHPPEREHVWSMADRSLSPVASKNPPTTAGTVCSLQLKIGSPLLHFLCLRMRCWQYLSTVGIRGCFNCSLPLPVRKICRSSNVLEPHRTVHSSSRAARVSRGPRQRKFNDIVNPLPFSHLGCKYVTFIAVGGTLQAPNTSCILQTREKVYHLETKLNSKKKKNERNTKLPL